MTVGDLLNAHWSEIATYAVACLCVVLVKDWK